MHFSIHVPSSLALIDIPSDMVTVEAHGRFYEQQSCELYNPLPHVMDAQTSVHQTVDETHAPLVQPMPQTMPSRCVHVRTTRNLI